MIYQPALLPHDAPMPYGLSEEWPFGRDSKAYVFPDETGRSGCWGFFDPN